MRGVTDKYNSVGFRCRFQLTRLMRGVTLDYCPNKDGAIFQLTRLMRGVTVYDKLIYYFYRISTHTPHARRDNENRENNGLFRHFNSHASCEA